MEIIFKKVNEITPYERNPRQNDDAVDAVANSIKEFGFKVPIIIDKDGVIAAGHTRLKAAKKLGMEQVPCIVADDLTPAQIKAFRLADNKTGELALWDFDLLSEELAELGNIDMTQFGFEDEAFPEDDPDVVEDDYEEPEQLEPRTKPGQLFRLGDHILMCGDSTKEDDVKKLIGGGSDGSLRDRSSIQRLPRFKRRTRNQTKRSETTPPEDGRPRDCERQLAERQRIYRVFEFSILQHDEQPAPRRRFLYLVCKQPES